MLRRYRLQTAKEAETISPVDNDDETSTPENDLIILKEAVINEMDIEVIKKMLNNTRALRKEQMKNLQFDIRENFPFLLSHPHLVILLCCSSFDVFKNLVFVLKCRLPLILSWTIRKSTPMR